ncbi:DUF1059 domain-containing protein [Patescibacteria group bacterium]
MKKLSCKDLGIDTCSFVAEGETNEAVKEKMMQHGHEAHDEKMHGMSDEEMAAMDAQMDAAITNDE